MKKSRFIAFLLACSLFAATPVLAIPVSEGLDNKGMDHTKEPKVITYKELDPAIKKAAEKAIDQYGSGKKFKLDKATKGEFFTGKEAIDRWLIENKDQSAVISMDANSGKILYISLTFAILELKGEYEKYLKAASAAAKQLQAEAPFIGARIDISSVESTKSQTLNFFTKDKQFIEIDLKTSKPLHYSFNYKASNVDSKIMRVAEQAVKSLGSSKFEPFTHIERKTNPLDAGGADIWELKRKKEIKVVDREKYLYVEIGGKEEKTFAVESHVLIEGKTGKLLSSFAAPKSDDQKQVQLTQKQALKIIIPVGKKLLGEDLSSYKVKADKFLKFYTFSSDNKESIRAVFDHYGNLIRMERIIKGRSVRF